MYLTKGDMDGTFSLVNNSSQSYNQSDGVEVLFRTTDNIIYMCVCSVIVALNIFLNASYIFLYYKVRIPDTNFNLCLAHYSAGAIVAYVGYLPYLYINVTTITTTDARVQKLLCGVFLEGLYFAFVGGVFNSFMLAFISITRFLIIKYPLKEILTKKKINCYVALFWVIAFIIMIPNAIPWKMYKKHGLCLRTLELGSVFNIIYLLSATVLIVLGPPIIMFVSLVNIVLHIFRKMDTTTNQTTLRHRNSIVKSLACLIGIFIVCGLGIFTYNVVQFLGYFSDTWEGKYRKYKFLRYALVPLLLEGVLNVVAYNFSNESIRKAYMELLKGMKTCLICSQSTVLRSSTTNSSQTPTSNV